jgi:hypothetical protein
MSESVLVVLGDPLVRILLGNALSTELPHARVLLVERGDEALTALTRRVFHVALVDAEATVEPGVGEPLWRRLAAQHPHMPTVVLGGAREGDPALPPRVPHFPRPLSIDAVVGKVLQVLGDHASGELTGIGLPAFLQLIELERKTCTVRARQSEREGSFTFERGILIHAQQGDLTGEDAAREMLGWTRPHLAVADSTAPPPNVTTRLAQLILEAFRLLDERAMPALAGQHGHAMSEPGEIDDAEGPAPPCTAEELMELVPGIVHGLVIRRRTGRILLAAGATIGGGAEGLARSVAFAYEAAAIAAAPSALAEMVSFAGERATLVWPSARSQVTLIVIVMRRAASAFALAAQLLRLRGW